MEDQGEKFDDDGQRCPLTGRFLKGSQLWQLCDPLDKGRTPKFDDPMKLLKIAEAYFNWVELNPMYEAKLVSYQGESKIEQVPKKRVRTVTGLCLMLGINGSTWEDWRHGIGPGKKSDFHRIVQYVDGEIRDQKFTGAVSEFFNPMIIARDLKLTDSKEISGPDGGAIQTENTNVNINPEDLDDDQLATLIDILGKASGSESS